MTGPGILDRFPARARRARAPRTADQRPASGATGEWALMGIRALRASTDLMTSLVGLARYHLLGEVPGEAPTRTSSKMAAVTYIGSGDEQEKDIAQLSGAEVFE